MPRESSSGQVSSWGNPFANNNVPIFTSLKGVPGASLSSNENANFSGGGNRAMASFWNTEKTIKINNAFFYVSTAGGAGESVRIGILEGSNNLASISRNVVADFGTVLVDTLGEKTVTPASPIIIPPGLYVSVVIMPANQPSFTGYHSHPSFSNYNGVVSSNTFRSFRWGQNNSNFSAMLSGGLGAITVGLTAGSETTHRVTQFVLYDFEVLS